MVPEVLLFGTTLRVLRSYGCSWWPEISPGLAGRLGRTVNPQTYLMGPLQMELPHFMG